MHDLIVIDQRHIARLPGEVEDEVVGNLDRGLHVRIVKGRAITISDRAGALVALILPATKRSDELIEEDLVARGRVPYERQGRRGGADRVIG